MNSSQDFPATELDPSFVFDFRSYDEPDADNQRWSTWYDVEPLCRGPEPLPGWVITDRAAVDTELGILKTGKEADVFLLERAVDGGPVGGDGRQALSRRTHRNFHRNAVYTGGGADATAARPELRPRAPRSAGPSRPGSGRPRSGTRSSGAGLAGLPVPYPVQIDGTELLMEWITHDGETAPRLAQTRPSPPLLASYFDQVREALALMAQHGIVHGDLSAYNILAAGERLVVIDLPQVLDLVGNPLGMDFLLRDCANVCAWFREQGPGSCRGRRAGAVQRRAGDGVLVLRQRRSMIVTLAWPPPSHIVCRP